MVHIDFETLFSNHPLWYDQWNGAMNKKWKTCEFMNFDTPWDHDCQRIQTTLTMNSMFGLLYLHTNYLHYTLEDTCGIDGLLSSLAGAHCWGSQGGEGE